MAPPFSLLLQSLLLAVWSSSTAFAQGDMQDGCIHMQIIHSTNQAYFSKRAVQFDLANRSDVAYYAKLNIGTPPQAQFVQLDTGSFELWVNPTCSGLPLGDSSFCSSVGFFDTSKSSTFSSLNTAKQLRYGIGVANITYVKDSITLPGTSSVLQQVQFGVATSTSDEFSGILGIGYGQGLATRYPNFIDELALQNVTKVKAFSLALGGKDEQEGVVVFGGVDTAKFNGTLARLPITPANQSPDGVPRYWIAMQSVTLTPPSRRSKTYLNSSMQVFLDSGSTLTLLPTALVDAIAADFGSTTPDSNGFFPVDCRLSNVNGTLDFAFAGTTIQVPYRELIRQSGSQCVLGIQGNSDFVLLGDTFLRSAYVVVDLENNAVWMTQYTNCGSSPAALASTAALTTLRGTCTSQRSLNDATSSSSSSASSTTTTSTSGRGSATSTSNRPSASTSGLESASSSAATRPRVAVALGLTLLAAFMGTMLSELV